MYGNFLRLLEASGTFARKVGEQHSSVELLLERLSGERTRPGERIHLLHIVEALAHAAKSIQEFAESYNLREVLKKAKKGNDENERSVFVASLIRKVESMIENGAVSPL